MCTLRNLDYISCPREITSPLRQTYLSVANEWYPTELRWWLPVLTLVNETGTFIKNKKKCKTNEDT
jgi:hypothetical protein